MDETFDIKNTSYLLPTFSKIPQGEKQQALRIIASVSPLRSFLLSTSFQNCWKVHKKEGKRAREGRRRKFLINWIGKWRRSMWRDEGNGIIKVAGVQNSRIIYPARCNYVSGSRLTGAAPNFERWYRPAVINSARKLVENPAES